MSQQQVGAAVGTPPGDTFADDSIAEYLKSHPEFFAQVGKQVQNLGLHADVER